MARRRDHNRRQLPWYKGNRVSSIGDTRYIAIGQENQNQKYPLNIVKTSKYTLWSFLPCNLVEQFRRMANLYFLATCIIVLSVSTPVNPITSLLPLVFVVTATAVKQGYEDFLRHKKDTRENTSPVTLIRNGVSQDTESRHVRVGDVVLVRCGQEVPCDMVLVGSSDDAGRCTVTTANLDGETNLKALAVPAPLRQVRYPEQLLALRGVIECEQPHSDLYRFYGRIELTEILVHGRGELRVSALRPSDTSNASFILGTCTTERDHIMTTIPSVVAFACSPTPSATERAIAVVGAFEDSPATTPTTEENASKTTLPPESSTAASLISDEEGAEAHDKSSEERRAQSLRPLLWRYFPGITRGDAAKKSATPSASKLPVPGEGAAAGSLNGSGKPRTSFSTWAASQDASGHTLRRASSPAPITPPTDFGAPQKIILNEERPHSVPDEASARKGESAHLAIVGPAPASRPSSLVTEDAGRPSGSRSAVTLPPALIAPPDDNNDDDDTTSAALTVDNLLLKGSRLHTDYVYGCAVYTGPQTKLALNSHFTRTKFSTLEKSINIYLCFQLAVLFLLVVTCVAGRYRNPGLEEQPHLDLLRFWVLFNYLLPISLYVSIECIKFIGAMFFTWDIKMYYERRAVCNSSDLNEELGQVQFLFTDKTGTLTENRMELKSCCINGLMYLDTGEHFLQYSLDEEQTAVPADMSLATIRHFFLALALCHTCRIPFDREDPHKDIEYTSCGPDERALLQAAARRGVVYMGEDSGCYVIRNNNKIYAYRVLDVLEFTSERRRMSVLVRDPSGTVWLFCKGALSSILPLIQHGRIKSISQRVRDFGLRGFRTLAVACRRLTDAELRMARRRLREARHNMTITRAVVVGQAYAFVESGMTIMGATAVEDQLQPLVHQTLEALNRASIKVWVLTGDQVETAVTVAYLCGHFRSGTKILYLTEHTNAAGVQAALEVFRQKVKQSDDFGLVVDGTSLSLALEHCPELFSDTGIRCVSVVCSRLSPLQKSQVVKLIKSRSERPTTAAIGDGANDVSMIQEAHVGIGIMGKEGRQAESCSDFALARFHFCRRAFLVHGHWYYTRLSMVIHFFFYKNIVFVLPQFCYVVLCGFSPVSMYDSLFLTAYNILFTSLPIVLVGLLEQRWPADALEQEPLHYTRIRENANMKIPQVLLWSLQGVWHSLAIFYASKSVLLYHMDGSASYEDQAIARCMGVSCFTIAVIIVNCKLLLESRYITSCLIGAVLLSIALCYAVSYGYHYIASGLGWGHVMLDSLKNVGSSPQYWQMLIVTVVAAMIPDTVIIVLLNSCDPDLRSKRPWWLKTFRRRTRSVRPVPAWNWVRFTKKTTRRDPTVEQTTT